jgi:FG-GAP-like repeat/Abnormal spindle-like microcephaly-assoc'd, ASPM-SPD-2-Hydin/FG-GAP repeat/PQQ enzyme repeat
MTECRRSGHICSRLFTLAAIVVGVCSFQSLPASCQVSVLTYHNDNARTGQNLNETVLTPGNVDQNSFGQLFTANVDGYVVAQPLYLQNVSIPNLGVHNVVYVETMHDSIYAFDADTGALLWQVSFINPGAGVTTVPVSETGCAGVTHFTEHGVVGTAVIDPNSGTLYLVAKTEENGAYVQRLHALDVGSGQEKFGGPVVISASFPGTGDGGNTVTFDPLRQMSRPGALQLGSTIFLAFGSNGCKLVHNHGWVLAYDAGTLEQLGVFNTTPNDNNGGIWQGGSGPAADSNGNIYFETADAVFDANTGGADYGDSILNLNWNAGGLSLSDYFTPLNQVNYDTQDLDVGSVGPVVLPDQPGSFPHLLVGSGKDATIYVINRDYMGGYNPVQDQIVQELSSPFNASTRFQAPTYWNGTVYFEQIQAPVAAYSLSNGTLSTLPVSQTQVTYQRANAASVSANGATNGILWVVTLNSSAGTATLHAFDATNLATEFYNSDQAGARDTLSPTVHFATPTIANGKVYLGTQTQFVAYGLLGVAPIASLSPTSLAFGNQLINTTSAPQTVTLTNTGTSNLSVNGVAASGDFAQTNNCNANIAVGASCAVNVTFTPTAAGSFTGAITFTDNASGSPQSVSLSGTGVVPAAPVVSLSPGSLNFANQTVGTTSPIQSSVLSNTGTATLLINTITASGDFALATTGTSCPYSGGTVNVSAGCTIDVTFTPTQTGSRTGSVAIADNAADSPQSLPLSGTGSQSATPVPFISQPPVPDVTVPSGAAFTLTLNGAGFVPASVVNWNGSPRTTTYISPTQLSAAIAASDIASAGTALVTVTNSAAGVPLSNAVSFGVTSPTPSLTFSRSDVTLGANALAAAGDFNNDGKLDLAVTASAGNIDVLLGNGDGTFQAPAIYAAGSGADAVALGDFNGDGNLDLVVANSSGNNVSVLLGNGDGTFQAAVNYPTGNDPDSLVVGDFNGDGKLDLAVGNASDNDVSVLLGNGDGTLQSAVNYAVGNTPLSAAVGDFNGDGVLDLAVVNSADNTVSVLLGNGDGTFQPAVNYAVGSSPVSIAAGDFNRDGKLDLVIGNSASNNLSVLLGNGDGTFQAAVNYGVGANPSSVSLADLNGDGNLDLAVANSGDNTTSTLLGNGDGTFQLAVPNSVGHSPGSVLTGDFAGAGRFGLVVVNAADATLSVLLQAPVFSLSAPGLNFGNQNVGTTSTAQTATVTNTGSATLYISNRMITGSNPSDFSETDNCGGSVPAGANCTVSVTFTPTGTGSRSAAVSFTDNASGSPHILTLSGTGTVPGVGLSPGSLTFALQLVGTPSASQAVTLNNTGTGPLNVSSVAITGTNSADFSQTNTCASSVPAGSNCTISVTFDPSQIGTRVAALNVSDNATGSPQSVSLSGGGTIVQLVPTQLNLGTILLGTQAGAQAITLTNTRSTALGVKGVSITGPNSGDFTQTNNCGSSVPPRGSCVINVIFAPLAVGVRNAFVSVADSGGGGSQRVPVTGTGTSVKLSSAALNFGNQKVGTLSSPQTVTLTNVGTAAFKIGMALKGTNPADFTETNTCGTSVAPGTNCTITVKFRPKATGSRSAIVSISDTGGASPQTVALSGNGT